MKKSIDDKIPVADKKKILEKKIRDLYRLKYNMDEISGLLSVSKSTVFYALKGRTSSKKRSHKKRST